MSEISKTGDGLAIVVDSSYSPHHNWMSLASWYSIRQNLPDAKVIVTVTRGLHGSELFTWPWRVNANFFQRNSKVDAVEAAKKKGLLGDYKMCLKIEPDVMAVRTFDPDWIGPYPVSEDCFATFVTYREGCGGFVLSRWINRTDPPFTNASQVFATDKLTVNEKRVFEIWEKLSRLAAAL